MFNLTILCLLLLILLLNGEAFKIKWKKKPVESLLINEYQSIIFECEFDNLPSNQFVMWLKNGVILSLNDKLADLKNENLYEIIDKYSLRIKNVTSFDRGQYTCQIFQSDEFKSSVNLSVIVAPKQGTIRIVENKIDEGLVEGNQVMLECNTNYDIYPQPIFKWFNAKNTLIQSSIENRLVIKNISRDDYLFKCLILNELMNHSFETQIQLSVEYKPDSFIHLNSNISFKNELLIFENETELILNCNSSSKPSTNYYEWYLNDQQLLIGYNNSKLILNNLNYKQHNGIYNCKSSNKHGSHISYFTLNVLYVHIEQANENVVELHEKQDATLECSFQTNMQIDSTKSLKWYYESKLESDSLKELTNDIQTFTSKRGHLKSILKLKNVDYDANNGYYKCVLHHQDYDSFGSIKNFNLNSIYFVKIEYQPKLKVNSNELFAQNNDKIEVVCTIRALPSITQLNWYFNKQPIVSSYKYNLTTTWLKSLNENKEEQLEMRLVINSISERDYGQYECKALNSIGESIIQVNVNKLTVPQIPFNLHASNITSNSLRLNWLMSASFNETYILSVNEQNEIHIENFDGSTKKSFTLKNLASNKNYTFRLKAKNSLGTSEFSNEIRVHLANELISNESRINRVYFNDKTEEICFDLIDNQKYDGIKLKIRPKSFDGSEINTYFTFEFTYNGYNCIKYTQITTSKNESSVYYEVPLERISTLTFPEFKNEYALVALLLCNSSNSICLSTQSYSSLTPYDYYLNYYYYLILVIVCSSILFIFLLFSLLCCLLTRPKSQSNPTNEKSDYQPTTTSNTLSIDTIESDIQSATSASSLSSQKFYQIYSATLIPPNNKFSPESGYSTPQHYTTSKKLFYEVIV